MNQMLTAEVVGFAITQGLAAGELLPLETGNQWHCREVSSGQSFTISVGSPVVLRSWRVYHYLSGYARGRILVDEAGNLAVHDEETRQESIVTQFRTRGAEW